MWSEFVIWVWCSVPHSKIWHHITLRHLTIIRIPWGWWCQTIASPRSIVVDLKRWTLIMKWYKLFIKISSIFFSCIDSAFNLTFLTGGGRSEEVTWDLFMASLPRLSPMLFWLREFCSSISDTKRVGLLEVLFCRRFICGTTNELGGWQDL